MVDFVGIRTAYSPAACVFLSVSRGAFILASLLRQLAAVEEELRTVDAEIARRGQGVPGVQVLLSMRGMGLVGAATVWAVIGDPTRFRSPKGVTRYGGLDPSVYQSGERASQGHISKNGSPMLRRGRSHLEQLWGLSLPEGERVWLAVALEQLRSTTEHLRAVEREIAHRVRHCRPVRQLMSIVGFHVIAAATYYAYVGDPWRFPSGKHVVSYAGLAPRVRQSGTVDRRGGISKEGPAVLRWALVEAAAVAARHGPPALRSFYLRLRATKGHQVAVVAVAAKLARIAWTLWRTGETFAGIRPERYAEKLAQLDAGAAPYPTDRVMAWLAQRVERLVDRPGSWSQNGVAATRAAVRASA